MQFNALRCAASVGAVAAQRDGALTHARRIYVIFPISRVVCIIYTTDSTSDSDAETSFGHEAQHHSRTSIISYSTYSYQCCSQVSCRGVPARRQ
eukprot:2147340-Pleurochrysis_carterae.AAC.1